MRSCIGAIKPALNPGVQNAIKTVDNESSQLVTFAFTAFSTREFVMAIKRKL